MAEQQLVKCDAPDCNEACLWLAINDIGEPKWRLCEEHAINADKNGKLKRYTLMLREEYDRNRGQVLDTQTQNRRGESNPNRASAGTQSAGLVRRSERSAQDRRGNSDNLPATQTYQPSSQEGRRGPETDGKPPALAETADRDPYSGAGQLQLTAEQMQALTAPIDPARLDIKPTGEVYLPQIEYRRTLNSIIGPGNWSLVPLDKPMIQDNTVVVHYALYIYGRFVSDAYGSMEYRPQNRRANWSDCAEGAKSDALSRCCKDLGIASECWDRAYDHDWTIHNAMRVRVKGYKGISDQWRKRSAPPIPGEIVDKRDGETEYHKPMTVDDEARAHMEGMRNDR